MNTSANKGLWAFLIIILVGAAAWGVMTMPDRRSTGEKVGDAIDALPHGVDNAAKQLGDRTPGQKLGDAVEKVGEDIQDSTDK